MPAAAVAVAVGGATLRRRLLLQLLLGRVRLDELVAALQTGRLNTLR